MLSFLRKNGLNIVYIIIIAFVVTTFLGVVFFNQSFDSSRKQSQLIDNRNNAIALIGELPVSKQVYTSEFQRLYSTLPQDKINSNSIEMIQLGALSKAVEYTLLLQVALSQKIKVSRSEINNSLYTIMDQFDVTDKNELKEKVKRLGGEYSDLINRLKYDLMVSKLKKTIITSIIITDLDKDSLKFEYKVRQIFIPKFSTSNVLLTQEENFQLANDIRLKIIDSTSFEFQSDNMNKLYGIEPMNEMDWITINKIPPEIARSIYSLNLKEISQPIQSPRGYFIVELLEKRVLENKSKVSNIQLKQDWQNLTYYSYISSLKNNKEIKVLDPMLRGIKFKQEGRFKDAKDAYAVLISQNPSNPYPHIFIAQINMVLGSLSEAKQELLKAEIKETLTDGQQIIPDIHIMLAKLYEMEGFNEKRNAQYDKLIKLKDVNVLRYLSKELKTINDKKRYAKVNQLIKDLTITKNIDIKDSSQLRLSEEPLNLSN